MRHGECSSDAVPRISLPATVLAAALAGSGSAGAPIDEPGSDEGAGPAVHEDPDDDVGSLVPPAAGSGLELTQHAATGAEPFGVRRLYPTKAGGREWHLPDDASRSDGEWAGGSTGVTATGEAGVWHVAGAPRITVSSPPGRAWWRNVELTGYYRLRAQLPLDGPPRGWQLYARSERHSTSLNIAGGSVNFGRQAPAGTATWPGYPWKGSINGHCLGSSYKGYINMNGSTMIKKEISHIAGYTDGRQRNQAFAGDVPTNRWFGFKVVIRNAAGNRHVNVQTWLDEYADGSWKKTSETTDTGGWNGGGAGLDGCTAAPFSYARDQLVTWAGPYVSFRFDSISSDFKWFSAREIDPLP